MPHFDLYLSINFNLFAVDDVHTRISMLNAAHDLAQREGGFVNQNVQSDTGSDEHE